MAPMHPAKATTTRGGSTASPASRYCDAAGGQCCCPLQVLALRRKDAPTGVGQGRRSEVGRMNQESWASLDRSRVSTGQRLGSASSAAKLVRKQSGRVRTMPAGSAWDLREIGARSCALEVWLRLPEAAELCSIMLTFSQTKGTGRTSVRPRGVWRGSILLRTSRRAKQRDCSQKR